MLTNRVLLPASARPARSTHPPLLPRRRHADGPGRGDRPAWQSPYGPPQRRAHRGRWAPSPVPSRSRRPAFAFALKH
ncbi:hypothetical protein GCM10009801_10270 [Streptomyces albiaxialis]|uniref:Uncharacterized protein n=1 Tax=Streptomyces albiaxialis TaxID=329523 RepID=A0ABN2VLR2_9ACTN